MFSVLILPVGVKVSTGGNGFRPKIAGFAGEADVGVAGDASGTLRGGTLSIIAVLGAGADLAGVTGGAEG